MGETNLTLRGRRVVAGAVGSLLMGGVVAGGVGLHEMNKQGDQEQFVTDYYSQPKIGERLATAVNDPNANEMHVGKQVFLYEVEKGDRIDTLAYKFGAEDHTRFVNELSAQVGGAGNLHEGDILAFPDDQVNKDNVLVDTGNQLPESSPWVTSPDGSIHEMSDSSVLFVVPTTPDK